MGNKAIEDESNWVETPSDMESDIDADINTFIGEKIGMMQQSSAWRRGRI